MTSEQFGAGVTKVAKVRAKLAAIIEDIDMTDDLVEVEISMIEEVEQELSTAIELLDPTFFDPDDDQ